MLPACCCSRELSRWLGADISDRHRGCIGLLAHQVEDGGDDDGAGYDGRVAPAADNGAINTPKLCLMRYVSKC